VIVTSGRRRAAAAAGLVAAVVATGGCADRDGGGQASVVTTTAVTVEQDHGHLDVAPPPTFTREEAATELVVGLRNYVVLGVPARVTGPTVWITATVVGGRQHELEVVDADGDPVGAIAPFRAEDGEQTLALELPPGSYTAHCLVRNGTRTHASMGMRQEFVVD
jgi:hypothetical protein